MAKALELSDLGKKSKTKPKAKPKAKSEDTSPKKAKSPKKKADASEKKSRKKKSESDVPEKKLPTKPKRVKPPKDSDLGELVEAGNVQVERLQSSAFDTNREQIDQYILMFNKLVRIARIAEKKYFKDKQSRDIYALMKVYDQLREVIADMRALQDITEYVDALDDDVMRPYIEQSATCLLTIIREVIEFGKSRLSEQDAVALENFVKQKGTASGVALDAAYRAAITSARRILAG